MKILLDVKDNNRCPFFMEMLNGLNYVSIIKTIKNRKKSQIISDLSEAFNDVRLYEQGRKKLKSAKVLLNEL